MDEQASSEIQKIDTQGDNDQVKKGKNDTENHVAEKRGRLISAAVIAVIILSFISVSVFGIFQVTTKLLVVCPFDLPVNDPAPVLWQDIVSDKTVSARIGTSEKMTDVYLKGLTLAETKAK